MIGQTLHDYDLELCDYVLGNIVQHMQTAGSASDARCWYDLLLQEMLTDISLLEHLLQRADQNADAEQVCVLLNDDELYRLALTFEGELDRRWEPYEPLHKRYIETLKDVRDNLSRQAAEDWSDACGRFARRLEDGRVRLHEGIDVIREWVGRLRTLLRAMGAVEFLPRPEGRSPTPTTLSSAAPVHQPSAATPLPVANHLAMTLDGRSTNTPPQRPAEPTRAYCLIPPNIVRWDGEIEVQQRLWHLVGVLLDKAGRASVEAIEEAVSPYKERKDKTLSNDASALNQQLERIRWPYTYRRKGGFVVAERNYPT